MADPLISGKAEAFPISEELGRSMYEIYNILLSVDVNNHKSFESI
jgi:hypothetical protein